MTEHEFRLTIHFVSSLDGFIAKTDNSTSWFETIDYYEKGDVLTEKETSDFLGTIDCYLLGARTYEHAVELSKTNGWIYGDTPVIVLSHKNLPAISDKIAFFSGDLQRLVHERLKPEYKQVWVAGGASLARDIIRQRLADDIRISIIPIILGDGLRLWDKMQPEQVLHLKNVIGYRNGLVDLHYEIKSLSKLY